jgi:hypothetical protein
MTRQRQKIEFEVLLVRSGLTATELSVKSGVPIRTIHDLRTREHRAAPSLRTVSPVAEALGVRLAALLRALEIPAQFRKALIRESRASVHNTA